MKLAECRATAREFSGKASEITRTLCYSAIAVIWVFRTQSEAGVALPASLFAPGFFVVLALALDLFHYISGAFVWSGFAAGIASFMGREKTLIRRCLGS